MAGDDGAALIAGEATAESSGFGADRDHRRKRVSAVGVVVGTDVSRSKLHHG